MHTPAGIIMKKQTKTFITCALTCLLMVGAGQVIAEEVPVPVKVVTVKSQSEPTMIKVMATLYSRHQIQLTAAINGQLSWVAEPGTFIRQGQPVAKMDLLPLQLQLAEQQIQVERATINLDFLTREFVRLEQLSRNNNASVFESEQTQSKRDLAKSDLNIAHLKIKQTQDQIKRAVITAPYDGVVTERLHHAGEDLNRSELIARMLDTRHLEARIFVPLKYLPYVAVGDEITLKTSEYALKSQVNNVIPFAQRLSQTFEVRMTLPQSASDYWAAGQLVKVAIPINKNRQLLIVHRDALIIRRESIYVMRINSDNKAQQIKVTVEQGDGEWVAVSGELKAGDSVAIRGAERLNTGQLVTLGS
jgi:RND family efflux transporter MFP subunit